MSGGTVRVTAEWALRGKEADDVGYRILKCSDGVLSRRNFEEILSRYSPGTLDHLPQVTISWLPDHHRQLSYLGIAVHDRSEEARYDRQGRDIEFTRYFCVPYAELAAGAVSYRAMYEGFRAFPLPTNDRAPITAELSVSRLAGPIPAPSADARRARRVAALLLTGKPVCILGADGVSLEERLGFLDAVMSLLPYGMRSRLSASTWTSSTYQGHKFRLFFASAPREADDCVVTLGRADSGPVGHPAADEYVRWLASRPPFALLAAQTEPTDFTTAGVQKLLEGLEALPDRTMSGQTAPGTDSLGQIPAPDLVELLISCAVILNEPDTRFRPKDLELLRSHLARPSTGEERQRYRRLIKLHRLLRADLPLDPRPQAEFYEVLLQLAFGKPLTYADYCEVEECVGYREGQPLHPTLLRAIFTTGLDNSNPGALLIVLEGFEPEDLRRILQANGVRPERLIAAMADPELRPAHARTVCMVALRELRRLRERARPLDRRALRTVLSEHGYLAPVLQHRHPGEPEYQLNVLTELLRTGHGDRLDRKEAAEILSVTPTSALVAAVVRMADPAAASAIVQDFTGRLLVDPSSDRLAVLLPGEEQPNEEQDGGRARPPHGVPPRVPRWLGRTQPKKG